MVVAWNVVDVVAIWGAIDTGLGMVERRIVDSPECPWSRYRTDGRATNDLDAAVGVEVPDTNGTISRSSNDLLLIELHAVNTVSVASHIDSTSFASLPVGVDLLASSVHQFPVLHASIRLADTGTTDLDGRWLDVSLLLEIAEIFSSPDERVRGKCSPGLANVLACSQGLCVEV